MNEDNGNKVTKKQLSYSLTREDLERCLPFECPVYHYKELKNFNTIDEMLRINDCCILFIETMRKKNNFTGHWCCVCRSPSSYNPDESAIVFFDSYGSMVDSVKKDIPDDYLEMSDQLENTLSKLMLMTNNNLEYNEYKFQKIGRPGFPINVCGRYVLLKLLSKDIPLINFQNFMKSKPVAPDMKTVILTEPLLDETKEPSEFMEKFSDFLLDFN